MKPPIYAAQSEVRSRRVTDEVGMYMKRRGEDGETLAEVLVSTTLLGIIGVGIIGAIASVLISTDIDRRSSHAETVLRSFASAITAAPYRECAGTADYESPANFDLPRHYRAKITSIEFWDGVGPEVVPTTTPAPSGAGPVKFDLGCTADRGLQQLKLEVAAIDGSGNPTGRATERLTLFKRNPTPTAPPSTP